MKTVTGNMKLELAQFREVAAFAQFGSDLDAATQQQLLRGSVLMELLKQKLFVPMPTERMVLSIFSGSNGYLDKVPLKKISEFEAAWVEYVSANHKEILEEIKSTGALSKDSEAKVHTAIQSFIGETDFVAAAA
jgi:F0F1-type ATP synthase alpha subunit